MSTVLVTGGAGFIGSHVVDRLLADGREVRVLDALLPAVHATVPPADPRAERVVADVRDAGAVAAALDGVSVVCHSAAVVGHGVDADDLPEFAGHNDLGTAVLLAQMARAQVGRLVLASSMVVYGEGRYTCPSHGAAAAPARAVADLDAGRFEPGCPVCGRDLEPADVGEDAVLDPRSSYAASKVAQEHYAAAWARLTGGTVSALRYHNVYGPRMPQGTPYSGVAALFRSSLEAGEPPRVYEDGAQRRDFVHVRDVAEANARALALPDPPAGLRAYNVASGSVRTIGEMAAQLAAAFGGPAPVVTGQYRLGDVRHVVADPSRARRELGFSAAVPFADGVAEFARAPLRPRVARPS